MGTPLDPSGTAGQNPPQQPSFTQTSVNVVSGTTTYTFPDLAPGDILSDVWVSIQTLVAINRTALQMAFVMSNELGQIIVPTITIPGNVQNDGDANNVFTFLAVVPVLYRAAINGRRLSFTITSVPAGQTLVGSVHLGVRRNFRPFEQWRT